MSLHAGLKFLQFELFIEEADLVEWLKSLLELRRGVFDELLEWLIAIYKPKEGMIHNEIIKADLILILLTLALFFCIL